MSIFFRCNLCGTERSTLSQMDQHVVMCHPQLYRMMADFIESSRTPSPAPGAENAPDADRTRASRPPRPPEPA